MNVSNTLSLRFVKRGLFFGILLCLFLNFFTTAEAAVILRPPNNLGLVGYWSFDEGRGTVAGDMSGNGNDATLGEGPLWSDGSFGGGMEFNGMDDYLVNTFPRPTAPTTISFWVKRSSTINSREDFVWAWNNGCIISLDSEGKLFIYDGSTYRTIDTLLANDEWHHIVRVDNGPGNELIFYVDGVEVAEYTSNISYGSSLHRWGASYNATSNFYEGKMDEVRIYNRALSETEVQKLYSHAGSTLVGQTPTDRYTEGLVAHWTFDGRHTTATTVTDIVGGNDGTIMGGASPFPGVIGQAMGFYGENDWVEVLNTPIMASTDEGTFSFWIKATPETVASGGARLVGNGSHAPDIQILSGGRISSRWILSGHGAADWPAFDVISTSAIQGGIYQHVALVYDSETCELAVYINGIKDKTALIAQADCLATQDLTKFGIGWIDRFDNTFEGSIDDVRIYNRALSTNEIQGLYSATKSSTMHSSSDELLTSGLAGHWTFDEGTIDGTAVADVSGNDKSGTIVSTPPDVVAGKIGDALEFDGSSGYVDFLAPLSSPDDWTYAYWFYPTAAPGADTAGLVGQGNNPRTTFQINGRISTGASYGASGWAGGVSSDPLSLNNWYHIVATWRGGSSEAPSDELYINGVLVNSHTYPGGAITRPSGAHYVNRRDSNSTLSGIVDDVRIYNRALSAEEAEQLYIMGQ